MAAFLLYIAWWYGIYALLTYLGAPAYIVVVLFFLGLLFAGGGK